MAPLKLGYVRPKHVDYIFFFTQERFALQGFKIQNYKVAIWAAVQGPVHDKGVIGMRLEGQIHHHIDHRELPVVCATMHSQPPF